MIVLTGEKYLYRCDTKSQNPSKRNELRLIREPGALALLSGSPGRHLKSESIVYKAKINSCGGQSFHKARERGTEMGMTNSKHCDCLPVN